MKLKMLELGLVVRVVGAVLLLVVVVLLLLFLFPSSSSSFFFFLLLVVVVVAVVVVLVVVVVRCGCCGCGCCGRRLRPSFFGDLKYRSRTPNHQGKNDVERGKARRRVKII